VGFGEAGSEIIAENMGKGGDVDPMLPGKKIIAVVNQWHTDFSGAVNHFKKRAHC